MTRKALGLLPAVAVTTVLMGGVVFSTAAPAYACDCAFPGDRGALEQSQVAFIGTSIDLSFAELADQYPHAVDEFGRPDPRANRTLRFRVERVFKGEVDSVQDIVTHGQGGACGLTLDTGMRYLVFGSTERALLGRPLEPSQIAGDFCNGTRPATSDDPPAGFQRGTRPAGLVERDDPPEPRAAPAEEGGDSNAWALPVAAVAGVAVVFVIGVAAARRIRRPS